MPTMYFTRSLQNVGKKGLPAMIFVQGGGGNMGNGLADFNTKYANATRDNELVAVSMNYKLTPKY